MRFSLALSVALARPRESARGAAHGPRPYPALFALRATIGALLVLFGCSKTTESGAHAKNGKGDAATSAASKRDGAVRGARGDAATPRDAGYDGASTARSGDASTDASDARDKDGGKLSTSDAGSAQCGALPMTAEHVPLDIYLMLDRSASMREKNAAGATKWDAVRAALTAFIGHPQASGLGLGLQYFPLGVPGVPDSCVVDADCGTSGGKCLSTYCAPGSTATNATLTPCLSISDCPFNSPSCGPAGTCSLDSTLACFNIGPNGCGASSAGDCVAIPGDCLDWASCVIDDYAKPAVTIAALPGNAQALLDSLSATKTIGQTPTPVALEGAIATAATRAQQFPDHRVVVVLATDGLPTICLPPDVKTADEASAAVAVAAMHGFTAEPSIRSYMIGIFVPDDPNPMANLDKIASAGGTVSARLVDAQQNVQAQLLEALSAIQQQAPACEYRLPVPTNGRNLELDRVNLQLAHAASAADPLVNVGDAAACEGRDLAWYYDAGSSTAKTPTRIVLCPKTCEAVSPPAADYIELLWGCATRH